MILVPDPADAPVMPPVLAPKVHAKLLAALAVNPIAGDVPLQMLALGALVTAGIGFTVTVIASGEPAHVPVVEVGMTLYTIEPAVELLGLVNTWSIVETEPADAFVIPPVLAPKVHVKLLAALAVKPITGDVPLQILAVDALVTVGIGFTVIA